MDTEIKKSTSVDLEKLIEDFTLLEQHITDLTAKNNILEIKLDGASRVLKFTQTKEKHLIEVENERLRGSVEELTQQNRRIAQEREAKVQRLLSQSRAEAESHQGAMEAVRQQYRVEAEAALRESLSQLTTRGVEARKTLEAKESEVEELKKTLKDQERDRQSEILKLQIEFGAKLARVQSTSQRGQQQTLSSGLISQNIFKRKLQFLQEEKDQEIEALRQRIRDLEEQHASRLADSRLKRKKI
ncbi:coiled-coil domain-containing protein 152 [Aplochiton taeniatus]